MLNEPIQVPFCFTFKRVWKNVDVFPRNAGKHKDTYCFAKKKTDYLLVIGYYSRRP
jgi:hypothetical protein